MRTHVLDVHHLPPLRAIAAVGAPPRVTLVVALLGQRLLRVGLLEVRVRVRVRVLGLGLGC